MKATEKMKTAAARSMFWQTYRRPAALIVSLTLILLLVAVAALLPHEGFVQELTVGGGVISDSDKLRDMRLAPIAILAQLILLLGLIVGAFNLPRISTTLFWILAGFLPLYLLWILPSVMPLVLIGLLGLSAGVAYHLSKNDWQQISGQFILAAAGAALSAHHLLGAGPTGAFALSLALVISAAMIVGPAVALWAGSAGSVVVALTVVLSAPFFWFGSPDTSISLLDGLHVLLALTVLAETAVVLRQSIKLDCGSCSVSSIGVATALMILTAPAVTAAFLPTDDYHYGEKLLAAQALFNEGGWFVSFFSPHGFSDATGAVVAWLQGEMTGTGIASGEQLFTWYAVTLLIWLLVRRLGPVPAAGLALVFPLSGASLLLALNLVLAIEAMALRKAIVAGALGATVAAAGIFFNAGPGAASAVVAGVAGVVLHWRWGGYRGVLLFAASGATMGLVLMGLFWTEVAGQLYFLQVSSSTNLTIYGNGSSVAMAQYPQNFLYFFAAMLTFTLALGKWSIERTASSKERQISLVAYLSPVIALALILNQYAAARLDSEGSRGMIVTCGLLIFLPVWLSLFQGRQSKPLLISGVCMLLLLCVTGGATNIREDLLPPIDRGPRAQIDEDLPKLGMGNANPEHVSMLREVSDVVETMLDPGETFLNVTNRNSFYFYFDRHNPVPMASTYNAAPNAFQRDFIGALGEAAPPLALVQIDNIDHDGLSLPLRSHLLYKFLVENYQPFVRGSYVYAIRNDLKSRLERLHPEDPRNFVTKQLYSIGNYTDENWMNGIAIGKAAQTWSFALPPSLRDLLRKDDRLLFSDGKERRVTIAEGTNVRTDPTLNLPQGNEPKPITFSFINRDPRPSNLWALAFHRGQLDRVPSAWGRSMENLEDGVQAVESRPTLIEIVDAAEGKDSEATFTVTGPDPRWVFAFPEPISPARAGLLSLQINCVGVDTYPIIQVFWRSSTGKFSEEASLRFEASFLDNLIPLDSSPYWFAQSEIAQIRIDVANPESCSIIKMGKFGLYDRL